MMRYGAYFKRVSKATLGVAALGTVSMYEKRLCFSYLGTVPL